MVGFLYLKMETQEKLNFINSQIFSLTISGAFSHGKGYPVFRKDKLVSEKQKSVFHGFLRKELEKLEDVYRQPVDSNRHNLNILKLKDEIIEDSKDILHEGKIRIGRVQKLLNLYLKYLWTLGRIAEPPHCPFDSIVIGRGLGLKNISWTKIDELDEYKNLVEKATSIARGKGLSISEWELKLFNGILK